MARSKRKKDEGGGVPQWVVTFGDMMSLLLTFFILLLSFSVMDEKKITQALEYFKEGALGVLPANTAFVAPHRPPTKYDERVPPSMEKAARQLRRRMQVLGRSEEVGVEYDPKEGGIRINLPSHILFPVGQAQLLPESGEVMVEVANVLGEIPEGAVEVRGHTDNVPISSGNFRDNYDLSYERAKNVMLYLVNQGPLPQGQYEIIARGESQPVADNTTEEGRAANRRVELFIRGNFAEETESTLGTMIESMSTPRGVEGGDQAEQEVIP